VILRRVPESDVQATPPEQADGATDRHRSSWMWIGGGLAVVAVGALIWAFALRSDLSDTQTQLDSTEQQLASTTQELDNAQEDLDNSQQKLESTTDELASTTQDLEAAQTPTPTPEDDGSRALVRVGVLGAAKSLYDDLTEQLGATQADLAQTEEDLEAAGKKADEAEKDAAAAQKKADQADDETAKAQAEADQAKAGQEAAESKASIAAGCAKAYISAFGLLFEGDSVRTQAAKAREEFSKITSDCKTALAGT
jgi:chromosome segregation ATPase